MAKKKIDENLINQLFDDNTVSTEGIFSSKKELLESNEANNYIKKAPMKEKTPEQKKEKETIVTTYVTKTLFEKIEKKTKKLNTTKSKLIRLAENLFYQSEALKKDDINYYELEKKTKKISFAYDKDILLTRAEKKGFNKMNQYINYAIYEMIEKI